MYYFEIFNFLIIFSDFLDKIILSTVIKEYEMGKIVEFEIDRANKIVRIGQGWDEAALEAVKQAKFTPGMQRGRPVRVQYSLPIVFRLQN